MSPAVLAVVWVALGIVTALLSRQRLTRRFTPVAALGAAAVVTAIGAGPGVSGPLLGEGLGTLSRAGAGLLVAGAVATALCLLLAPGVQGVEGLTAGVAGAAAVLLLSTSSALYWGLAALAAFVAVAVRWVTVSPGRATLAAGRVGGTGAACVVAAAAFLPVTGLPTGPRPNLVGGLLLMGIAAGLALVPLGGWAVGVLGSVRGAEVAPWLLLLAPAVALSSLAMPGELPLGGAQTLQRGLLLTGLVSAVWGGIQAWRGDPGRRYGRVVLADLGLIAAAIGSLQPAARSAVLLLLLTHLVAAPVLLQPSRSGGERQRRLLWVALSGLPPTPSFWGRYLVVAACAGAGAQAAQAALVAAGLLLVAACLAFVRGEPLADDEPLDASRRGISWVLGLGVFVIGLAPEGVGRVLFGGL